MRVLSFGRDEIGTVSIEAALALPLFLAVTIGAIDLSVYNNVQTAMNNAASETIRALSIDAISVQDAQTLIANRLSVWTNSATTFISTSDGDISVTINVPTSDIPAVGIINIFENKPTLTVSAAGVALK